jgi:hypothetical protein
MRRAACTALIVLTACLEPPVPLGDGPAAGERALVVEVPPQLSERLDLLFVVDNSETMDDEQMALQMAFERLRGHLGFVAGGMPDLHVGVVSTDLGVGDSEVPGCTAEGDGGRLQHTPRIGECAAPADAFIRDEVAGGLRITNYESSLTETFGCISQLGETGCRYEQPLESMRLALDRNHAYNTGFLRDDAILAVVFLTNEDDCTAWNPTLYDPALDGAAEGSKYRCFRHGVQCLGDDVREEGEFEGCEPRHDSQFMPHVTEYIDFLLDPTDNGLGKPDPLRQVVVAGMIGDTELGSVEIHLDGEGEPQLVPACADSETDSIYPAVRLQSFLDGFTNGGQISSLCNNEPTGALTSTGREIRKRLGTICLDGPIKDADPETAGRQPDCQVLIRWPDPRAPKTELPACDQPYMPDDSTAQPCYTIKTGPEMCGDFPTQLALDVSWGAGKQQPAGAHIEGWCLVDSE